MVAVCREVSRVLVCAGLTGQYPPLLEHQTGILPHMSCEGQEKQPIPPLDPIFESCEWNPSHWVCTTGGWGWGPPVQAS